MGGANMVVAENVWWLSKMVKREVVVGDVCVKRVVVGDVF